MPQTTVEQRFLVISHYNKGKSVNFISKSWKIPRTTIYNIIQRYNKDPTTLENRPKKGRPQILDKFEQKLIIRKCFAQPNLNSTQLLASQITKSFYKLRPEAVIEKRITCKSLHFKTVSFQSKST